MSTFEAILNDALTSPEKLWALRARSRDAESDEEIRK